MTKFIICMACAVLLLSGCGNHIGEKALEEQIEKETGSNADVNISEDSMNIRGKTENGAFSLSSGEGVEIPDNFPADILIYKPSELKSALETSNGQSLAFTTTDDVSEVIVAYKREMTDEGWTEETSMNIGQQSMLVYNKQDRVVQITVGPSDDRTQILLIISND
jgi:hypothetical protein